MKGIIKTCKVCIALAVLSLLFLFSPLVLFPRKPTAVNSSIVNSSALAEDRVESSASLDANIGELDDVCDNCRQAAPSTVVPIEAGEKEEFTEVNTQPDCSLEEEITTKDFQAYQKDGIVYVEIFGEVTTRKGAAAYDFVRRQGCLTSSPNLVFVNE